MKQKMFLLFFFFTLCALSASGVEQIPEGPWTYVNGHWVRVELPDRDSAWEWIPGHWNEAGRWVPGHWKKIANVPGQFWRAGHWDARGHWVAGHWVKDKDKTWVPTHRGPRGRVIPGHVEVR